MRFVLCLTYLLYPDVLGDLAGQVLAYISLLPIAILVGFVTLIVFKRELHTVSPTHAPLSWDLRESTALTGSLCSWWFVLTKVCKRSCFVPLQISFLVGLALNEGVNWLLKHILREPRPCAGEWTTYDVFRWSSSLPVSTLLWLETYTNFPKPFLK